MGEFSVYHWVLVGLIVLLFFGGRKIPELMRGIGRGIQSFREGLAGSEKRPGETSSKGPADSNT